MKSFYEFTGNWLSALDCLVGVMTPANVQKFSIWQSKSSNKKNLLIVYELWLDLEWENKNGIRKISEDGFSSNYKNCMGDFVVHGRNEFFQPRESSFLKKIVGSF